MREAARVCADVAADLGVQTAEGVVRQLSRPVGDAATDLAQVTSLFNRVVAYVDARVVGRT